LDGADKEACEKKWTEIWYQEAYKCSQTECERKADAEYESKLNECLETGANEENCKAEAQAHKEEVLKLCECQENASDEYEENRQECEGLEGEDRTECEIKMREMYAAALDECIPKTACEEEADAEYKKKKDECLATGEDEEFCEYEAQNHKA